MKVIGMMSGTSYDGIDAAAADLRIEGDTIVLTPLGLVTEEYDEGLRARISAALPPAPTTMDEVCRLDTEIGQAFAAVAQRAQGELCDGAADLVVSHGQTVFHWVEDGRVRGTLQIGQPAWIAEATGLPVVADVRSRDVAAGGQGAPLVSAFDVLWLRGRPGTPVALNLGGIANITVAAPDRDPVAFDIGPANALIDAAMGHITEGARSFDEGGAVAARGTVSVELLDILLDEPYYSLPAPKSTGKELFHLPYLLERLAGFECLADEDLIATLTALTARTVAVAVRDAEGTELIAAGGGTRNATLMTMLSAELAGVPVHASDDLGVPAEAKEAYAFALLGFLAAHGIPGTVPSCTGARHSSVLGTIVPGREALRPSSRPGIHPTRLVIDDA